MATLAHPSAPAFASDVDAGTGAPRRSGFEILVPVAAIYVVLLVIGPFLAMHFHH